MQANYVQRLRLTFRKEGPARYISHLDLARTLERALNRARIPVAYSQGFNKRPKLSMASALPLGYTSSNELADVWLTEEMEPEAARVQMMSKMAPGIDIFTVKEVLLSAPSLQSATLSAAYVAVPLDPVDVPALRQQVDDLIAAKNRVRVRARGKKRKEYDLRPLILDLSLSETDSGTPALTMRLSLAPSKTGRPDEVLLELGLDPLAARIQRTHIALDEA